MDIKDFKAEAEKENEGVWVDCGDDLEIKVTRMFNASFNRAIATKRKPHGRRFDRSLELQEKVLIEVMADVVILDWKGLTDGGKAVKFSKSKALEFLTDSRDFRNLVSQIADDISNFQIETQEEDAKN
jgi:hypothetical protein